MECVQEDILKKPCTIFPPSVQNTDDHPVDKSVGTSDGLAMGTITRRLPPEYQQGDTPSLQITRTSGNRIHPYTLKTCNTYAMGQCQRQKRKRLSAIGCYQRNRMNNHQERISRQSTSLGAMYMFLPAIAGLVMELKILPLHHILLADRADIIDRVFEKKVRDYIDFVRDSNTFGSVTGVLYTIEFQKRGLPHSNPRAHVREEGWRLQIAISQSYSNKTNIDKKDLCIIDEETTENQVKINMFWLDNRMQRTEADNCIWPWRNRKQHINAKAIQRVLRTEDKNCLTSQPQATLIQITAPNGWYYRKCNSCNIKVSDNSDLALCHNHGPQPTPNYGYCFRAIIDDGIATTTVTCFSPEAHTFVPDCNTIVNTMQDKDTSHVPAELKQTEGQTYIFQYHFGQKAKPGYPNFKLDAVLQPVAEPLLALPAAETIKSPSTQVLDEASISNNPTTTNKDQPEADKLPAQTSAEIPEAQAKKTRRSLFQDTDATAKKTRRNA
ncbi:DNA helicase [Tanacetum coccineum]